MVAFALGLFIGILLLSPSANVVDPESVARTGLVVPDPTTAGGTAATASVVPEATTGQASSDREMPPPEPAAVEPPREEITSDPPVERAEASPEAKPVEPAAKSPEVPTGPKGGAAAPARRVPEAPTRTAAAKASTGAPSPGGAPKYRGSLAIRSQPSAAVVSVDGRVVGSTPVVLDAVAIGSRIVRIEAPGYERWSSVARVIANKKTSIEASLQRSSK